MTPDDLIQLEQIKRLKYAYIRLLDLKQFDELGECFVPDATSSYSDGRKSLSSRDEIVEFFARNLSDPRLLTNHKVHQPEIELTGPDTAEATWALDDEVIALDYDTTLRGTAFYHDRYVRTEAGWRIQHTGYERVYEEVHPRSADVRLTSNRFADPDASRT